MVMKTLTVGLIAVLLGAAVLDMAQGKPKLGKHALAKLEHSEHVHSKLEHSNPAKGKAVHRLDSPEAYVKCMTTGLQCIYGCFYESLNITTNNGELNKDVYAKTLVELDIGIDQDEATKAADECEARLADIPVDDICKRGLEVDFCMGRAIQ